MTELLSAAEAALKAKEVWARAVYELEQAIRVKGLFETLGEATHEQNRCVTCGENTYEHFRMTGTAHICDEEANNG